jgi:hypothetical protein
MFYICVYILLYMHISILFSGIWDLRSEIITEYNPYPSSSSVTAVRAHPWKQDLLISSSSCGTVKSTDLLGNIKGIHDCVIYCFVVAGSVCLRRTYRE